MSSGQQVRPLSRGRTRTTEVADLVSVRVMHSGSAEGGCTATSMRLAWQNWERHEIDGDFGSELARSLRPRLALGQPDYRW